MAKQSEQQLTGLLQIPIITSRTGPMKRLCADLHETAKRLDRARNAIVRAWLRWREDHPAWAPPPACDKDGMPKLRKSGEPILISPMHPEVVAEDGSPGEWEQVAVAGCTRKQWRRKSDGAEGVGFSTYLYHVGRRASPTVAAILIASAAKEVVSNLMTDIQHHGEGHKYRWQAILANDEQAPSFRMRNIPVPNNTALFVYNGISAGGKQASAAEKKLAEYWGESSAVLLFPLFAGDAGRATKSPIVTLNVGAQSPGNRRVLAKVARGEWKWSDSKLVQKKGQWQIQFTYRQPSKDLGLNKDRVAVLTPQFPEGQRPFRLDCAATGKQWHCGNGLWLSAEFDRLDTRRKRLRERYKVASSGVKGHGRKRFEARLKPWARKTQDCQRHFCWQLIAEVVRFCKANDCGSVVYCEPSLGIRDSLWLAKHGQTGIPFDWTGLATDLAFKLGLNGIECTIERTNGKDLRERLGGGAESAAKVAQGANGKGAAPDSAKPAARVAETAAGVGDAAGAGKRGRFRGGRQ